MTSIWSSSDGIDKNNNTCTSLLGSSTTETNLISSSSSTSSSSTTNINSTETIINDSTVRSITPESNSSIITSSYPSVTVNGDITLQDYDTSLLLSSRTGSALSTYTIANQQQQDGNDTIIPSTSTTTILITDKGNMSPSITTAASNVPASKLPKFRLKLGSSKSASSSDDTTTTASTLSSSESPSLGTSNVDDPSQQQQQSFHPSLPLQTPSVSGNHQIITPFLLDPSLFVDKEIFSQLQDFSTTLSNIMEARKQELSQINNMEWYRPNEEENGTTNSLSFFQNKYALSQDISENVGGTTRNRHKGHNSSTTTTKKQRSNISANNSQNISDASDDEGKEGGPTQSKRTRKTELRFTFPDSDDDLGENENAPVDRDETFTMPSLRILRNITRKSTNDNLDSKKSRKYTPMVGSSLHIEGSNTAVSKGSLTHTIAHRLSEGCIVNCACCKLAYETYWNRPRKQRKMKRLKVGIENGYIDICDSDIFAVEALSGLSIDTVRQAMQTARNFQSMDTSTVNDHEDRSPLDTISGRIPEVIHHSIRSKLVADLLTGKLTASIDWPRRVVWILVCGEWEIRNRKEKEANTPTTKSQVSIPGERKLSSRRKQPSVNSSTANNSEEDEDSEASDNASGNDEHPKDSCTPTETVKESIVQSLPRRKPGRPPMKLSDHNDENRNAQYRRPFRIKVRDVRAYLSLGEPQYAPTLDDEDYLDHSIPSPNTPSNGIDDNGTVNNGNANTLSRTSPIPSPNETTSTLSSTAKTTTPIMASLSSCTSTVTTANTSNGSSNRTSSRSLRSNQGSLSNISLKHGKCPFTETDAIHALIRVNYKAPHYIDIIEEKGRCVFAGGYLPRGAFFCEYGGQLLSEEEAHLREARYSREAGNYGTGCYSYYFRHPVTRIEHCVDATAERKEYGIGRLLSHSMRHPNLACKVYIVDGVPRLVLHTKIDIIFGDEMKYDYGERSELVLAKFEWLRE